jgi:hypothetical protein
MKSSTPFFSTLLCVGAAAFAEGESKTTLGGYAEAEYVNPVAGPAAKSFADVNRLVLFVSHGFNDKLSFHSELEVEHVLTELTKKSATVTTIDKVSANGDSVKTKSSSVLTDVSSPGYVAVEQAFVDYRLGTTAGFRTGLLLVPVGIVNEVHEPNTYNGVHRPLYANSFIPTTWRDLGVIAYGDPMEGLHLKGGVMAGFLGANIGGASGLRSGRQKGGKSNAENLSLVGRAEYTIPYAKLGFSAWFGGTSGGDTAVGDGNFDAPLLIVAGDVRAEYQGLFLRAEGGVIDLPDAEKLQTVYKKNPGERMVGGYVEVAYDVLPLVLPETEHALLPFVRFEKIDTHFEVPSNVVANELNSQTQVVAGLTWKPHTQVSFKADYSWLRNEADVNGTDLVKLGVGCSF